MLISTIFLYKDKYEEAIIALLWAIFGDYELRFQYKDARVTGGRNTTHAGRGGAVV